MCKRMECAKCGATPNQACKHDHWNECIREDETCSTCGAIAAEPCREEAA